MNSYDYLTPKSFTEVWDFNKKFPGAGYIAGGTDLMVRIKQREIKPRALISLRSIPELSGIDIGDRIRLGAMTTITDLIQHPDLGRILPVLIQAAKRLGGTQIRNVATLGGNLCNCSPCADTALPLLVLEARVVLKGPEGAREIPLSDFFVSPGESRLLPGEILTDILLDKPSADTRSVFMKKGRVRMDLAIASLALLVEIKSSGPGCSKVRIAAGSVAPVPLRLKEVEQLLENTGISEEIFLNAQKMAEGIVSPITDIRSTEDYRRRIVGVYLKRALRKLIYTNGEWHKKK
jgi:carbon-monoxide dehydrogenase medium subunit